MGRDSHPRGAPCGGALCLLQPFLCLWAWCASELFVTHLDFKIDVAERNRWLRFQCNCQVLLESLCCWACRDGLLRAGAWLCSAAIPLSHQEQWREKALPEKSSHVSKLSQLWQDHCTKFLEVIQRNNSNLLDVEYMWGLEQKWNALCPFYIYCDYIQVITSGKLSWINFWYKALILSSFPNDLLQATTITTKKQLLRNYWGRKAGTWKINFELLYKWINTEWNLMLCKCFSLLCNRTSEKNDTSKFVYHPLDCLLPKAISKFTKQNGLNGLLVPVVHMDDFWIFFGRSMLDFLECLEVWQGHCWWDTQRLVVPRQLWPKGFSVLPQE